MAKLVSMCPKCGFRESELTAHELNREDGYEEHTYECMSDDCEFKWAERFIFDGKIRYMDTSVINKQATTKYEEQAKWVEYLDDSSRLSDLE